LIRLCASGYRAIPQIQDGRLRCQILVPITEQSPACDSGHEKNAGSDGKQGPSAATLMRLSELGEITVARAAGAQVIEPLLGFRERHLVQGDFLENAGTWAPDSLGIWELLE